MKTKSKLAMLLLMILLPACVNPVASSPEPLDTASPFPLPPTGTPVPTLVAPPVETVTPGTASAISMEPTYTVTTPPSLAYDLPVFPGARDVSYNIGFVTRNPGSSVYYSISAELGEIEAFYVQELSRAGWAWVYTDKGESLTPTLLSPSLMMEFQKEDHKLGIAAHGFGGDSIVLAGTDTSGGTMTSDFIAGVSGGLDWMGPSELDTRSDAMHFSSTLVEFPHSFYWIPTDQLMQIYHSDKAITYRPHKNFCQTSTEICFVNFLAG